MSQHLLSFGLKKTILFKDVQFEIPKGISVFYGLNRTNGRKSMQANGAGKSSFWSSIGETLYEEPIVGLKEDTVKQGTRFVNLMIKGKKVEVVRTNSKLEIKINGKPKQFRKKSDGRDWLKRNLPLSQTEFNTYAYLDARVPHPLVMGTSTERKRFFNEAFGLDKIDVERRMFEAELSKLKRVKAAYQELKAVFDADKEKALPKEERLKLERRLKALQEELEDLGEKNKRLQVIEQVLAFERSARKEIEVFERLCPNLEEFSSIYGEVEANLKDNRRKLKDAEAWHEYQKDSRRYTKALGALGEFAAKLVRKNGVKGAIKACRTAVEELDELQEKVARHEKLRSQRPSKPEELNGKLPRQSRKELLAELEALEHKLEHAEKFGTGKCGTCGQDVKIKSPKKLKERIAEVEADLEKWAEVKDYEEALETYKAWRLEFKALDRDMEEVGHSISVAKKFKKALKELRDLPSEPEPFEGRKLEIEVCQKMVDEDREQLRLLEFMQPNLDSVEQLRKLTDKQRNAGKLAPKLQERINEIHEKMSKLKARLEVNSMVTSQLKRHRERLLEMREELKEEEALKLIVDAYADKNMKRDAVKAVSSRLMAEVNKYAKSIFPEDYEFEFRWDSSKVQLLVHRKYREGKKTKVITSDVRKLSGAESKLYTFILVLAHLTFVPSRKRSNVLILDEPSANFSGETTESFKRLLPILNKVIPSIIVITPRTDERYEGAQEFTVLKEKGEAKVVKGHPSTIK